MRSRPQYLEVFGSHSRTGAVIGSQIQSKGFWCSGQLQLGMPVCQSSSQVGIGTGKSIPGVRTCQVLHGFLSSTSMVGFTKIHKNFGNTNLIRKPKRFLCSPQSFQGYQRQQSASIYRVVGAAMFISRAVVFRLRSQACKSFVHSSMGSISLHIRVFLNVRQQPA